MLMVSLPIAIFMFLASRVKFYQLVYFIGALLLVHLTYNAEIKKATKKCINDHNQRSKKIEFDANCYKETKVDKDSDDPDEHMCFIMRRYCAKQCSTSVYGKKCDVESLFTLNLEEEDDGTPYTLDCLCSYNKYTKGCLSTYQVLWEFVLEEFAINCSASSQVSEVKILLIGGKDSIAGSSMEFYYPDNPNRNQWLTESMIQPRKGHTSFLADDRIVFTFGSFGNIIQYMSSWETFDLESYEVLPGGNIDSRGYAGFAFFGGIPHICGGLKEPNDIHSKISSCIREKALGTWEFAFDLPNRCATFPMAEMTDYLYIMGGQCLNAGGRTITTNMVHRYGMKVNKWEAMKPMKQKRHGSSAAVLDALLFVCGGRCCWDDGKLLEGIDLSTCESYNPGKGSWKYVAEMKNKRSWFKLVAVDGRLFALGGQPNKKSVEMLDPKTKEWKNNGQLIHERVDSTAVVVP